MSSAVFVWTLQLQPDLAGAITFEPFIGDRRADDIAAPVLKLFALIDAIAHPICRSKPCALAHGPGCGEHQTTA